MRKVRKIEIVRTNDNPRNYPRGGIMVEIVVIIIPELSIGRRSNDKYSEKWEEHDG